jgi:hypothetical protein
MKLGQASSVSGRLNPNSQDTLTVDTVGTLQYDSATFVIYVLTGQHHEFLVEATITGSRYFRSSPFPSARLFRGYGPTSVTQVEITLPRSPITALGVTIL